jgi:hypothetical protein
LPRAVAEALVSGTLIAQRWSHEGGNVRGPAPPRRALLAMLENLAGVLRARGEHPLAMKVESWRRPNYVAPDGHNDFLARITIQSAPGLDTRSLASWFQWQHPRWRWSDSSFPAELQLDAFEVAQ